MVIVLHSCVSIINFLFVKCSCFEIFGIMYKFKCFYEHGLFMGFTSELSNSPPLFPSTLDAGTKPAA